MVKFKVGDEVRCIPGFSNSGYPQEHNGGAGYETGLVFIIKKISHETNTDRDGGPIYWEGKGNCGVFEQALELAKVVSWKERLMK